MGSVSKAFKKVTGFITGSSDNAPTVNAPNPAQDIENPEKEAQVELGDTATDQEKRKSRGKRSLRINMGSNTGGASKGLNIV